MIRIIGFGFGGWWTMLREVVILALIAYAIYYPVTSSSRTREHSSYPTLSKWKSIRDIKRTIHKG